MSEKINLYVKFIQNEQKRLNASTVVAPRTPQLNEVAPLVGALALRGAAWAAKKLVQKAAEKQAAKVAGEKAAGEVAKKAGEETVKKGPEGLVLLGRRSPNAPTKPLYRPAPKTEPTTTSTASPSAPMPQYKPETSKSILGPAIAATAAVGGGAAALKQGTEPRGETEAEKTESPSDTLKRLNKQVSDMNKQLDNTEGKLKAVEKAQATPAASEDDEAEKYVSPIEKRARSLKKEALEEALERFSSLRKPRIPNISEQEAIKAKPAAQTKDDSQLEDEPAIDPKEQGAKFQPMVKSPEYMEYLRQNQDKIRAKKAEPANPVKSATSTSTSVDMEAL